MSTAPTQEFILPPPPIDLETPVVDGVIPQGWEHLAGPFRWFEITSTVVEMDPEFGWVLPVRTVGRLGSLAQQISNNGDLPFRTILLSGPPGVGKSVFELLLARTKLAKRLEAVGYDSEDAQGNPVRILLVDAATRKPFYLNPPINDPVAGLAWTRRQMSASGDQKNYRLWHVNAGKTNKGDFDDIIQQVNKPRPLPGDKQVFVISEFDNMQKSQIPSLKDGLNPGSVPKEVLFMADTNDLAKVQAVIGTAGMERFNLKLKIAAWTTDQLTYYARHYGDAYGITFEAHSFVGKGDPAQIIGEACRGSIRRLFEYLQILRGELLPIPHTSLIHALSEAAATPEVTSRSSVERFVELIVRRRSHSEEFVGKYVASLLKDEISIHGFIEDLAAHLMRRYPAVLAHTLVSAAFQSALTTALLPDNDQPVQSARWSALAAPLHAIARILYEHTEPATDRVPVTRVYRTAANG